MRRMAKLLQRMITRGGQVANSIKQRTVKVGEFVNVMITDVYDGELIGEVEEDEE